MRKLLTVLALLSIAAPPAAFGQPARQSISAIRDAAEDFVRARAGRFAASVQVRASGPDARLRLAACGQALTTSMPPGGRIDSRTTVQVRCPGPSPWRIYVPVEVNRFGKVAIAARSFSRGESATAASVTMVKRNLDQLPFGWFDSVADLAGRHFVRSVPQGTVITPAMLAVNNVVHRGQQVVLVAKAGGVQVRMAGRALADAAPGERVRVENLSSHRVVEGVVRASQLVEVMP